MLSLRSRRGAALLYTMLVLMIFSIVGMSMASSTVQSLRLSRMQESSSRAFNLAESGCERALLWLRQQAAPPSQVTPFDPFGGANQLGLGYYTVTIDGDDSNPGLELKRYSIRSRGVVGGRQETVEVLVQLSNFGRYAYFTDYETSSITSGPIYFKAGEVVDGPAHSNNTGNTDFSINWTSSTAPIFRDQLTGVSSTINYAPSAPSSEEEFKKVFQDGSRGFRLGVKRVELPESTDRQKVAAWGSTTGFPGSTGVYINAAGSVPLGGVYICGDASVELVDGGSSKQVLQILQGSTRYKVTVDRSASTTTMRRGDSDWADENGGGTVASYAGLVNGVVYATGNITGLKGELADSLMSGSTLLSRNAWTVATDMVNGKNVTITGSLFYNTSPDKTRPWDDPVNLKAAALGVVARNIILDDTCPANLTIQGVMLAGGKNTSDGSFYAENWSSRAVGTLSLTGSIIQKKRGPVGTFNSFTGTQSSGYQKNYGYDRRMAVNPPPFFPTTGTYDRLSWSRLSGGNG